MSQSAQNTPPMARRVRAYFAPVNRLTQQATLFDPAQHGAFAFNSPPAPWIDLGWIDNFKRASGTKITPLKSGTPAATQLQARAEVDATLSFSFQTWGKLQLALSAGTQQLNLLQTAGDSTSEGSGGTALAAVALAAGSTADVLQVSQAVASAIVVGQWVVVDVDYTGQTGFVGSGVSGAYVKSAFTDIDYIRRVTLNVGRVTAVTATSLTLEWPLLAGIPSASMKLSNAVGFCDREGSSFFQEWSALFVAEGQQGERVLWHYPRLQTLSGIAEDREPSAGGYEKVTLAAAFRALPVKDPVDKETVVCFRSYVAA